MNPTPRTSEQDAEPGEEHGVGTGMSGVKAGNISNRQLTIYDKRREVLSDACGGEVGASLVAGGLALAQGAVNFVAGYLTRESKQKP